MAQNLFSDWVRDAEEIFVISEQLISKLFKGWIWDCMKHNNPSHVIWLPCKVNWHSLHSDHITEMDGEMLHFWHSSEWCSLLKLQIDFYRASTSSSLIDPKMRPSGVLVKWVLCIAHEWCGFGELKQGFKQVWGIENGCRSCQVCRCSQGFFWVDGHIRRFAEISMHSFLILNYCQ